MISSDIIRGYNDIIILSILIDAPSYGYEISKRIKEITQGTYIIKETTLYSAFSRLQKNGFIESFSRSETFGKKRTYYKITILGESYYNDKCLEWKITKDVINKFVKETY